MKKIVRLGIWGCKHGVDGHGVVVKNIDAARLVALCDNDEKTLAEAAEKIGTDLERYTDPISMFSQIDAVIIATRDIDHIDHMRLAIEHGLHVLIEKPIAVTEEQMVEFHDLLVIAATKGLVVTSCHPRRFDLPFLWLKQNLSRFSRELGPITSFHYDFTYHEPSAGWKQLNRSLLLDHHGHEIDLVSFLFGQTAFTEYLHDDSADRYLVSGIRRDGIKFSFYGMRRVKERVFYEWMTVRFLRGSVTANTSTGVAKIQDNNKGTAWEEECGKTDYEIRSLGVTKNFVDAINGEAPNYLTPEDMFLNNLSGIRLLKKGTYISNS